MRHIAGLAFGQVFAKHLVGVLADAGVHQKAGKVGARNQLGVAHIGQGALKGSCNADLGQSFGHFHGPLFSPAAGVAQTLQQGGIAGIKTQAHDMHRLANEGDGNFHAGQIAHAQRLSRRQGTRLAANLVVVGQCPELHAVGLGTLGECFGCEGAIGDHRVAREVGVE